MKFWNLHTELPGLVALSLIKTMKMYPAVGWVRSNLIASSEANKKIITLQNTIEELQKEINNISYKSPEGAESLSQGSDIVELKAKLSYLNSRLPYGDSEKRYSVNAKFIFTWDELFSIVGPSAIHPNREKKLKSEITKYIKDFFSDPIEEKCQDGFSLSSITLNDTQFQTIKYQFSALGFLVTTQEVRMERDSEKEFEFCELTPLGKKKLMEVRAIYKDKEAEEPDKMGLLLAIE
ncbi:hypothetical protein [Agarilytica rhodophyticola]|uniref:hypothetical protein n=1 Tax=Agarilytica rhodophyticola TaxID=1737490 RepID=UPI001C1FDD52|nr:hypothetical protein [Agarilytica rhodophyticola]